MKTSQKDLDYYDRMIIMARRRAIEKEAEEEYLEKTTAVFDFSDLLI